MGNRPYVWVGHEETHAYDDIIELPHPVSETHPHMSMLDRAAQFSPFDALTGYSDAIDETARPTDARRELSEQELQELDERITLLEEDCRAAARGRFAGDDARRPLVTVTWFVPDAQLHRQSRKGGGAYLTRSGRVKRIDRAEGTLTFLDGARSGQTIPLADIVELSGERFSAGQEEMKKEETV
jgi:hypothetical protein